MSAVKTFSAIICVANTIIRGYKLTPQVIDTINSHYSHNLYRYKKKPIFKVRVYCIIIYYLFRAARIRGSVSLRICRDFDGKQNDIMSNLNYFLKDLLKIKLDIVSFSRLYDSNAHKYAYLMRKDNRNQMKNYVRISVEEIERFLKK